MEKDERVILIVGRSKQIKVKVHELIENPKSVRATIIGEMGVGQKAATKMVVGMLQQVKLNSHEILLTESVKHATAKEMGEALKLTIQRIEDTTYVPRAKKKEYKDRYYRRHFTKSKW